ncbi:unnamed protein product [Mytilus edulis]|uniref:YqaJ viral recombinase domain-containing protein n=1 Tax=Mytilus edulis TaxID=6550 RepID=A0A8S3QWU2_MYTED|nr:unnamed protein product [Mytilus edulis]
MQSASCLCKNLKIGRVYRALTSGQESGEDDGIDAVTCNIQDFELLKDDWKKIDTLDIPPLQVKDVDNYFHYQKNPTTGTRISFDKHMIKAKRFCDENFIYDIFYNKIDVDSDHCYFKANCLPSMRLKVQVGNSGQMSTFYSLHVCLSKKTGYILSGHCNCKAENKNSCTSDACQWDRPRPIARKPSPKRVKDITFAKTDKDKTDKVKPYPGAYKPSSCDNDENEFLSEILDGLKDIYPTCVLYKTLRTECSIDKFLDTYNPQFVYRDTVDLKSETCKNVFSTFLNDMVITMDTSKQLELSTRGQHININWINARSKLLTASVFGDVCKRITDKPDCLIRRILNYDVSQQNLKVKSLEWGRLKERVAVKEYQINHLKTCQNVTVENKGLLVNPNYPYLGASIDSFVSCQVCGCGIVEMKCPYGSDKDEPPWRKRQPQQCAVDVKFCCELENGRLKLKGNHKYMFQVQGQMALYEVPWVDFVVWTTKGISVERISFDEALWKDMLFKLNSFYLNSIIPEFFSCRVKRGKTLFPK